MAGSKIDKHVAQLFIITVAQFLASTWLTFSLTFINFIILLYHRTRGLFPSFLLYPTPCPKRRTKKDVRLALGAASDVLQEPCRAAREGLPWGQPLPRWGQRCNRKSEKRGCQKIRSCDRCIQHPTPTV